MNGFSTCKLIIHVPFTQNVRIRSVLLKLGELCPIQDPLAVNDDMQAEEK
jgi:hypothetical protein